MMDVFWTFTRQIDGVQLIYDHCFMCVAPPITERPDLLTMKIIHLHMLTIFLRYFLNPLEEMYDINCGYNLKLFLTKYTQSDRVGLYILK